MLRKPIRFFLALVMVAVVVTAATAALPPGAIKEDYKDIMPLSQVKPGMKAYGLTVFRGTKIEKFDVKIISILPKMNNGKSLILASMSGGPITGRHANIMQGMSGSPVYINGKIIGAVAYGPGGFSKEPLGMLTPIEDMLDSLDPKLPAHPSGLSSLSSPLDTPLSAGADTFNRVEIGRPGSPSTAEDGTLAMTPLMTPVSVSGMSSRGIGKLAEILQPFGLQPMAGPGGGQSNAPSPKLEPGAAFGLSLASGDIDMTAVGTVTYRRGNKIVGFGHPMFGIGPIDAPLTTAYVHDVFPSYQISSKIASPIKTIGHISQDRPWSVGGEIGVTAKTIPLTIDVDDQAIGRKKTFHVNVINHPLLAPKLVMLTTAEALSEVHGIPSDAMAKVKLVVNADQIGKIVRDNEFFDPASVETASLDDMQGLLNILANNKFYPVDVKSVHMSVTIEPGRKTATIERIVVDKTKYEPGDTVHIDVELRPYKARKIVKTVDLKIPENTPDGRMTLSVKGGMSSGGDGPMVIVVGDGSSGPRIGPSQSSGSADNVRQLVDKYLKREKNNDMVAKMALPTPSLSVGGEKLSNLPDPIAGVMKSTRSSSTKFEKDEIKTVLPMNYIVVGEQNLSVKVERVRHDEKKQPQPPSGPDGPQFGPGAPPPPSMDQPDESMTDEQPEFATPVQLTKDEVKAPAVSVQDSPETPDESAEPTPRAVTAPAPAADPKPDAKPEGSKTAEKPVGRQPSVWKQTTFKDFSIGTFIGTAASTGDDVRLAPELSKLTSLTEMYAWRAISDGHGGIYVGTGNNGIIYHVDAAGKSRELFKTGELEVHALALDSRGNLYAGTSPHGKVFKVTPEGKGKLYFSTGQKYVLALACDSKNNIYAGVGDAGKVYAIAPDGKSRVFASVNENSVLSLTIDKSDNVYFGTGRDGIVYKASPSGTATPIYDAPEDTISSIAVDRAGNVYAGTGSGKGNIYKIKPSGAADAVFDKAPHALSMAVDASDNVYVASDENVFKITPDEKVMAVDTGRAGAQFISIAASGNGIIAGSGNYGAVYKSKTSSESTYESAIRDAGAPAIWGSIGWIASTPGASKVSIATRSGNIAEPDSSWSPWSAAYAKPSGQPITSPAGRYIQYKAIFDASGGDPVLDQVTIAYLPQNRAPKLTINDPQPGAVIARNQVIRWTGSDPDKDSLTYDIFYSADSGKTWKPIGKGVTSDKAAPQTPKPEAKPEPKASPKPEPTKKSGAETTQPSKADLMAQLKAGLDQHPEIPQDVKDKMIDSAPDAIDKATAASSTDTAPPPDSGPAAPGNTGAAMKQTSYSWDTSKVVDGDYELKVVASDRISNASGFLTDEKIVGPITVSNTPPKVFVDQKTLKIAADGTVTVDGRANDPRAAITGVQYKADDGDWMAAAAKDGIFDSTEESFAVATQPLAKGKHTIEIKAIDAAGNGASEKVTANIP